MALFKKLLNSSAFFTQILQRQNYCSQHISKYFFFFLKTYLFLYFKGRASETRRERERKQDLSLSDSLPKWLKYPFIAGPDGHQDPGTPPWFPMRVAEGHLLLLYQIHQQGTGSEAGQLGLHQHPCGIPALQPLAPICFLFCSNSC